MAANAARLRVAEEAPVGPRYADIGDVQEFAKGLPDKFLECRELGHLWRPHDASRFRDGGFERVLRCSRCSTKRVQQIDSRGIVLKQHYDHPEGYLTDGMGRIVGDGRGALRIENIVRYTEKLSAKGRLSVIEGEAGVKLADVKEAPADAKSARGRRTNKGKGK